jgi:hypothetical protein
VAEEILRVLRPLARQLASKNDEVITRLVVAKLIARTFRSRRDYLVVHAESIALDGTGHVVEALGHGRELDRNSWLMFRDERSATRERPDLSSYAAMAGTEQWKDNLVRQPVKRFTQCRNAQVDDE